MNCFPDPVSYTHLDVYKRQGTEYVYVGSSTATDGLSFGCFIGLFSFVVGLLITAIPSISCLLYTSPLRLPHFQP